jgi:hypothetical protein
MSDGAPLGVPPTPGWTIETYAVHNEALRQAQMRFDEERDRRYAEIATEREKALKIKETADLAALGLAREIQTYKDEKANELRSQIENERGSYATKTDLTAAVEKIEETIKPIASFVNSQQGRSIGATESRSGIYATVAVVCSVAVAAAAIIGFVVGHLP